MNILVDPEIDSKVANYVNNNYRHMLLWENDKLKKDMYSIGIHDASLVYRYENIYSWTN